ncbi:RNA polymerase sigma factor [Ktedonospora formicarum]|uniref:RNA polymerase sigma factor n=1 Tax=Ktedonospora formicarum TaxID=2778364 RepID=A0A8J3I917_9CHLR|nr:sigma-70 family RNA polymerase sigma factor [Ktedonospora formicarum]GHO48247.1 RNA polymerase sigma factor [Ktedonospora formicarum]
MQQHLHMPAGNDAFAAELYQRYAQEIFVYLRMHTPTREDAEDVLIDVFLAALEQKNFQKVPIEKQRAYLWRVAQNKANDVYRRLKRRPVSPVEQVADSLHFDENQEPEQQFMRTESYALLRSHIQRLPELQRKLLHLRFVNGLRSKEIAQILNKREGTVRMLLSRTLNTLRSIYEKHSEG